MNSRAPLVLTLGEPAGIGPDLCVMLAGIADGTAAQYIPQALGAGILLMSLITDYEFSLAKLVPMPVHLGVDTGGLRSSYLGPPESVRGGAQMAAVGRKPDSPRN